MFLEKIGDLLAEEGFRLPGSVYEELVNIIVAYGTRDEASNPGDVGKLDPVHRASVSRNNDFLTRIGVLQGGQHRLVTRRGRALALALWHRDGEAIRRCWREIIAQEEFLQNVISAVKLRDGMPRSSLLAYIAHCARVPRNKPTMTGASTIVDILKTAGLLYEEAGELSANLDDEIVEAADGHLEPPASVLEEPAQMELSISTGKEISGSGVQPGIDTAVTIQIQVRCTADDVENLGPKLKALIRELSGPQSF